MNPFPDPANFMDEEGDGMAFGLGIGDGLKRLKPLPRRYKSSKANPYYYYPGFAIGYLVKVIGIYIIARYGGVV